MIGTVDAFQVGVNHWEQYAERLDQYFAANNIADEKKLAVFLTVIGAKTYVLLSDLLAPAKPATKTNDELVAALKGHLQPKPVVIAERFRFHQRKQEEGEGVAQYMATLRRLADKCEFRDHLDEVLRDRFVCGLHREAIQRKLLTVDGLTLKTAYDTAYGMEVAEKQAGELQVSVRPTATVQLVAKRRAAGPSTTKPSGSTCHRCGKTGHSPDYCFYRKEKCGVCGATGHISRVCKKRKTPRSRGTNLVEQDDDFEEDEEYDLPLLHIRMVKPYVLQTGIMLDMQIDGKPLLMELDTGASMSIISEATWRSVLEAQTLLPSKIWLKTYTGHGLDRSRCL